MTAWPMVPLGEVLTKSNEWIRLDPSSNYRQVTVKLWGQGVVERSVVTGQEIGSETRLAVRAGQFLISRIDARNGAAGLVPESLDGAVVSNDFPAFTVNSNRLDFRFLGWYSRTAKFVDDCKAASEGTTNRVRLKEDRFYSIAMPLPQIEEQRRIVERLEALGQKVGSVRQIAAELSQTTGQLATVLARRMFDGLTPTRQLGSVVSVVGGGTPSKGNPEFWNGSIPWVSPKDMKVRIIQDSADHISESAIRGSAAKLVQPGAVLIVVRGMILAHTVPSAVLAIPATINQDMKALIPNEGLDSAFLSAQLWAFNRELLALVEKSTHDTRKLETDKLLQFPVIVPPLDVQRAVCGDLRQLEEKTKLIAEHRKAEQMGIGALMPSILNQAFCGGL